MLEKLIQVFLNFTRFQSDTNYKIPDKKKDFKYKTTLFITENIKLFPENTFEKLSLR